jgi:glycosyltransferase involved in cell wall biosynthesis
VEIILVDDCSTDETVSLCREAQKKDSRIRFFSTPWATGIGQARNLALKVAQGQWVFFLDPEDWVCKGFLAGCVQELKSTKGSDILDCSWQAYSAEKEQVMAEKQAKATDLRDWLLGKVEKSGLWSKVVHKEFLASHAIDFLPHQKVDEVFFLTQIYTTDPKIKATHLKSVCHVVEKSEYTECQILRVDFEESITSILAMHRLLTEKGYATTSEEYKQILQSYAGNEICEHLLQYVYVLKKIGGTSADRISELKDVLGFLEKCVYSYKKRANDEDSDDSEDKD